MEAASRRSSLRIAWLFPILVGACFALQIAAVAYVAFHSMPPAGAQLNTVPGARPIAAWYHDAPFRLIAHAFGAPRWLWPLFTLLGIIQRIALYLLYRAILRDGFGGMLRATAWKWRSEFEPLAAS